jgi:hypothetical protein
MGVGSGVGFGAAPNHDNRLGNPDTEIRAIKIARRRKSIRKKRSIREESPYQP